MHSLGHLWQVHYECFQTVSCHKQDVDVLPSQMVVSDVESMEEQVIVEKWLDIETLSPNIEQSFHDFQEFEVKYAEICFKWNIS